MPTIHPGNPYTNTLRPGATLTLVAPVGGMALVERVIAPGVVDKTTVSAGAICVYGPYLGTCPVRVTAFAQPCVAMLGTSDAPATSAVPFTIAGSYTVGGTATVTPGPGWAITGSNVGQWYMDGVAVSGATLYTYTFQAGDAGKLPTFKPLNLPFTVTGSVVPAAPVAPSISAAPVLSAVAAGGAINFTTGTFVGTPAYSLMRGVTVLAANITSGQVVAGTVADDQVFVRLVASSAGQAPAQADSNTVVVSAAQLIYNIILLLGQSNMAGRGVVDSSVDTASPKIFQYGSRASNTGTYRQLTGIPIADPLDEPETSGLTAVGPGMSFAKNYLLTEDPVNDILLVPCAWGGTTLVEGELITWSPYINPNNQGNREYLFAIAQANAAIAAAVGARPGSKVVAMVDLQEGDGTFSVPGGVYVKAKLQLVASLRAAITGAANAPYIIGQPSPELIARNPGVDQVTLAATNGSGTLDQMQKAQIAVAASIAKGASTAAPGGYIAADQLHLTAQGQRGTDGKGGQGLNLFNGLASAKTAVGDTTAPGTPTGAVASTDGNTATLTITAGSGGTARYHEVWYAPAGSGLFRYKTAFLASGQGANVVLGLNTATAYDYQVRSGNAAGVSAFSATFSGTTAGGGTLRQFVTMSSVTGSKITVNDEGVWGKTYNVPAASAFATDHVGVSSLKLPLGVDGAVLFTAATDQNYLTEQALLGLIASATDPNPTTGVTGYKYSGLNHNGGFYKNLFDGGSASQGNTLQASWQVLPGDIMRLRVVSNMVYLDVARARTPDLWIRLNSFATARTTDLWIGVAFNNTGTSTRKMGPIVATGGWVAG